MKTCPDCKIQLPAGKIYCPECGAFLIEKKQLPLSPRCVSITLVHIINGHIWTFSQPKILIGRKYPEQNTFPDLDLTNFQAHKKGVSRTHAQIDIHENIALITDLGSANGTWLNGRRLLPSTPYPIKNNDMIQIGQISLQILMEIQQ